MQRREGASRQGGSTARAAGLGLWDAVSIIIGIVIGAGIYETAPLVFASVSSPAAGLLVWVAGGVLSLIGAACYAELASTYPRSGGDYVYLTKAFGPLFGFSFGWAQLTVILTGSIGMMAYVFADYAVALFGLTAGAGVVLSASAVLVLTLLNVGSSSLGTKAQNLLSLAKLLGVVGVALTGLVLAVQRLPEPAAAAAPSATGAAPIGSLGLAMISALGAVNALIFTGSRLHATLGSDYSALSRLGSWNQRLGSPVVALVVQLAITLTMVLLVGTRAGRDAIDGFLVSVGRSPARWSGHGGFDTLLSCTAPVFWLFFLLTGVSLMRLRHVDPNRERPFRVPLYPLTPLLFCSTCAYMLYSSVAYAGSLTWIGVVPLLLGVPVYFASKRRPAAGRVMPEPVASGAE